MIRCPEDGQPMVMRQSKYGPFLACTLWPKCDITHSVHPNGTPMGTPANRQTRVARTDAHAVFDRFWQSMGWAKSDAYRWLAQAMGIDERMAHIAHFNFNQCKALIAVVHDAITDVTLFAGQVDDKSGHVFTADEIVQAARRPKTEDEVIREYRSRGKQVEQQFKNYKGNRIRHLKRDMWRKGEE